MSYNNGMNNAPAASRLGFLVKYGDVKLQDRGLIDDALPNNWRMYADNAAGTGRIHYMIPVDTNNQSQINNPNGLICWALAVQQLATPAVPVITNAGTAGSTSYTYKIVALSGFGVTLGSTPASTGGSTATGNATLTTTNYNIITFPFVTGAAFYQVYRTASSGTPSSTGVIGTVIATNSPGYPGTQTTSYVFNDTGIAGDSTTAPTTNTTGAVSIPILAGSVTVPVVPTPTGIVATVNGTVGVTSNTYKLVAVAQVGTSAASSGTTPTTCNATLTATNSVTLTWDASDGAVSYNIYRTTSGGTPSSTGLIGNVLASAPLSFTDTGIAGDSSTPPSTNTTGALNLARINDTNGNAELIFSATANAVNSFTVTNAATATGVSLAASGSDTNISATFAGKGNGSVLLGQSTSLGVELVADQPILDSSGNAYISFSKTANAVNGLVVTDTATGNPPILASGGTASDANTGLTINSKGTGAVTLAPGGAAGTIVIGGTAQTGTTTLGSSSGNSTVAIANGAGVNTVTVANVGTAGSTVTIAGAATAANATDTVNVLTGALTANATKKLNILTAVAGTAGDSAAFIGGGANSSVTVNALATTYTDWNYTTASGANNAVQITLHDSNGNNVSQAAGLKLLVSMGAITLTAGANTLSLNGGANASIKSATNPANNIGTAISANAMIQLAFNGTVYCLLGQ